MEHIDLYTAMGSRLGINNQEVSRQVQEYETNYLTPEMDSENFKALLCLISDDQAVKEQWNGIPITWLSSYCGRDYGILTRPFSYKAVIENIIPFLVVNEWFKVFYLEEKENTDTKSDYIIVDPKVKKSEVETELRDRHEYSSFYLDLDGKTTPTNKSSYKIIRLEEITV